MFGSKTVNLALTVGILVISLVSLLLSLHAYSCIRKKLSFKSVPNRRLRILKNICFAFIPINICALLFSITSLELKLSQGERQHRNLCSSAPLNLQCCRCNGGAGGYYVVNYQHMFSRDIIGVFHRENVLGVFPSFVSVLMCLGGMRNIGNYGGFRNYSGYF